MRRSVIVLGLVVALLAVGGILLRPRGGPDRTAAAPAEAGAADAASTVDVVARSIDAARKRLDRVPGDWTTWAQLGVACVEQARA